MSRRARLSSILGWVIIGHGALAAVFAVLTAVNLVTSSLLQLGAAAGTQPLASVIALVGFVPIALVAVHRRRELTSGDASDRLKALYFIASGLAVVAALVFFRGIAHDVALWFGIHGRFGCHVVDDAGHDPYLIDGDSLPWLLFLPEPLVVAVLLRLSSRARGLR